MFENDVYICNIFKDEFNSVGVSKMSKKQAEQCAVENCLQKLNCVTGTKLPVIVWANVTKYPWVLSLCDTCSSNPSIQFMLFGNRNCADIEQTHNGRIQLHKSWNLKGSLVDDLLLHTLITKYNTNISGERWHLALFNNVFVGNSNCCEILQNMYKLSSINCTGKNELLSYIK